MTQLRIHHVLVSDAGRAYQELYRRMLLDPRMKR